MSKATMWSCQWPGCPFLSASEVRRGERMKFLKFCVHHGGQFRAMTNAECAELASRCTPAQSYVGTDERQLLTDVDAHEMPRPRGRRVA